MAPQGLARADRSLPVDAIVVDANALEVQLLRQTLWEQGAGHAGNTREVDEQYKGPSLGSGIGLAAGPSIKPLPETRESPQVAVQVGKQTRRRSGRSVQLAAASLSESLPTLAGSGDGVQGGDFSQHQQKRSTEIFSTTPANVSRPSPFRSRAGSFGLGPSTDPCTTGRELLCSSSGIRN